MAEKENTWNTPEAFEQLAEIAWNADQIDSELYAQYDVKRGLRDQNGRGVLAGLTHVSEVRAVKQLPNGETVPDYGHLIYRGYDIEDLMKGFMREGRPGFEETAYLLLFGHLPNGEELKTFSKQLIEYRTLSTGFIRDIIMKRPTPDMMNTIQRSVLSLYGYDDNPNDTSLPNTIRQCMQLISKVPLISVYGYYANQSDALNESLYILSPLDHGTFAENVLHILRSDGEYTPIEVATLDAALVLHMDHGGGNNSTFTTHVVTSSMTDTYSVMSAAMGSLKGPRHGGANLKVVSMFDDMKEQVRDWNDEEELSLYLKKLLHKEAFDKAGLIYGVGHAVYSKSDPRALILKNFVRKLAVDKGREKELQLYENVERLAPEIIASERKMYKGVCANVDFYSGFAYDMLGLPKELYTPLFAMARIVGWSAHRIEELANSSKIIRPGFKCIEEDKSYILLEDRD